MAPTVDVTGPGTIIGSRVVQGDTYWGWSFPVVVDGNAGVYVIWVNTNDPANEPGIVQDVIDLLTNDPGDLSGIVMVDPGDGDRGDHGDPGDSDQGDDDDDGMLADGGTGGGEGDSV